tara:strand:+ start:2825 stop:7213 length:4389 start_codon:yes stop_codon:yes gene_type:complete
MPRSIEEIETEEEEAKQLSFQTKQEQFPTVDPEVLEILEGIEQEEKEGSAFLGTVGGLGVELGGGLASTAYLNKLHKSGKLLNFLSKAKYFSLGGFAGPQAAEPVSTITGGAAFIGSSAALWGFSNFLGQKVREASGLQEGVSYGELLTTGVFGALTGPSSSTVNLLSTLGKKGSEKQVLKATGQSLTELGVYKKGGTVLLNGTKTFIGGASFAVAETAVRQELQIAMNERDKRDTYEYLFAAGIGGSLNSILSIWGRTGKWGRNEQIRITDKAKDSVKGRLDNLKAQLKEQQNSGDSGFFHNRKIKKLNKEIKETEDAFKLLDSASKQFKDVDEVTTKIETGKTKESFNDEVKTPISDKIPEDVGDDTSMILDDVKDLIKESEEIDIKKVQDRETGQQSDIQITQPELLGKAVSLNEELKDEISNEIARILKKEKKGADVTNHYKRLKVLVENQKTLHQEVIDTPNMVAGRTLLANQSRRGLFLGRFRSKSQSKELRDQAFEDLSKSIDNKISKIKGVDEDVTSLKGVLKKVDQDLDQIKKVNAAVGKTRKLTRTPAVRPIAQKESQKTIEKLEAELEKLRAGDVDLGKETRKVKKDKAQQEAVLKQKINFYKQAQKELRQVDVLEKELDDLLKMSPKDFAKLTAKEKKRKDLLKKKQVESKVKKLQTKIDKTRKNLRTILKAMETRKAKDIDAEFYTSLEKYFYQSIENSFGFKFRRGLNTVTTMRQASLIDQVSSVVAGIPSGAYGLTKTFVKAHTNIISNILQKRGIGLTAKLYFGNLTASFQMFAGLKEALKAGYLSAKRLQSVTDPGKDSKFIDTESKFSMGKGIPRSVKQAKVSAERRAAAKQNILNFADRHFVFGSIWNVMSLGLRGIIGVDEVFRRQLTKVRVASKARTQAILEHENNPKISVKEREKEILDTVWKKNGDGINVIQETEEMLTEINFAREEMFYAASKDNVDDIHIALVNRALESFRKFLGKTPEGNFLVRTFIPFMDVVVRGVYRGARLTALGTGLPSIARAKVLNPYSRKINKLKAEQKTLQKKKKEFIPEDNPRKTKQQYLEELADEEAEILERIERLRTRRTEYNEELLADSVVGASLLAMGATGGLMEDDDGNPLVTGGLGYLTPSQRKKFKERGISSYRAGGIPYQAMIPLSLPMAFSSDISYWIKLKQKNLLNSDQDFPAVMISSLRTFVNELPFNQGIEQLSNLIPQKLDKSTEGVLKKEFADLMASYSMVPAQVKKITKLFTGEGKVADLKGGDFYDRFLYSAFGVFPENNQVDIFGDDIVSSQNPLQSTLRFTPDTKEEITSYDTVAAADVLGILNTEIKPNLVYGIKMRDYRNEEGRTLFYEFAKRLRKTNIKKDVQDLISSTDWKNRFNKGSTEIGEKGEQTNEALQQLEGLIRMYWDQVTEDILFENKSFLESFINEDENSLYNEIQLKEESIYLGDETIRKVDPLKLKD